MAETGSGNVARRVITDTAAKQDYETIMKAVRDMNWSGKYGPSVQIQTKIKWENAACRQLYLKVKQDLHDKKIPNQPLYYYVGAIGNWGKAGFRISGHSKSLGYLKAHPNANCVTHGVLHIEG